MRDKEEIKIVKLQKVPTGNLHIGIRAQTFGRAGNILYNFLKSIYYFNFQKCTRIVYIL